MKKNGIQINVAHGKNEDYVKQSIDLLLDNVDIYVDMSRGADRVIDEMDVIYKQGVVIVQSTNSYISRIALKSVDLQGYDKQVIESQVKFISQSDLSVLLGMNKNEHSYIWNIMKYSKEINK